jgi:8-oxo-dGTP pyrophosphatase MutT (NUDIX family)
MPTVPDQRLRAALDPLPTGWNGKPGLRDAAVLAPWFTRDGVDWLLFTRRRDDLPHHPGQISFPGGAREGQEGPVHCALRETEEEIGLSPDRVEVLGALPPRFSVAGFWVQVVVGRIPAEAELRPDPREVAALVAMPVAALADPAAWDERPPATDPSRRPTPHFAWEGQLLWGLTARFTLDLLERVGLGR